MRYLVTGGTGSFGRHFVDYILKHRPYDTVTVFSRDELKQFDMRNEIKCDRVKYIIGDIRDRDSCHLACQNVGRVIHAAALKHVRTGEEQPWETIMTNVLGTQNITDAARDNRKPIVLLSTDKAVEPVNAYGATKMLAERIVLDYEHGKVVRYGNVFGSRGSILHIFQKQYAEGHEFTITDKRMTRFIITFEQAIELVLDAFETNKKLFIPKLKSIYITDLAKAFDKDAKFKEIGKQPGEKFAENLGHYTSDEATKMTVDEIRRLIDELV